MLSSVLITFHKSYTYEKVSIYSYVYSKDREEIIHNPGVNKVFLPAYPDYQLITDLIIFGKI